MGDSGENWNRPTPPSRREVAGIWYSAHPLGVGALRKSNQLSERLLNDRRSDGLAPALSQLFFRQISAIEGSVGIKPETDRLSLHVS